MILDHIAHLTRFIKVSPAAFDAHFFRDGDLYVVDSAVVPVVGEQRVGETQRQQVQHRFFTQVMVNAEHLALFEIFTDLVVDFLRRFQRGAERFFHHHARRFSVQLRLAEAFADSAEGAGRHSEIVDGDAVFLIEHFAQTRKVRRIVNVQVAKIETIAETIPQRFVDFLFHEGFQRLTHHFGVGRLVPFRTSDADNTGLLMDLPGLFQLIQGRQQFPARQIAFGAKNDQIACLGCLCYRHSYLLVAG